MDYRGSGYRGSDYRGSEFGFGVWAVDLAGGCSITWRGWPRGRSALILLADQDRDRWDIVMIAEGETLIELALKVGRPGPYQLHAAIAACHSLAASAQETDWPQIAALYGELIRHEPTPVVAANQVVAVAMADGPQAGLAILDRLAEDGRLDRWPQLHIARAELLQRLDRSTDALGEYRAALAVGLPAAEQEYIARRIAAL